MRSRKSERRGACKSAVMRFPRFGFEDLLLLLVAIALAAALLIWLDVISPLSL